MNPDPLHVPEEELWPVDWFERGYRAGQRSYRAGIRLTALLGLLALVVGFLAGLTFNAAALRGAGHPVLVARSDVDDRRPGAPGAGEASTRRDPFGDELVIRRMGAEVLVIAQPVKPAARPRGAETAGAPLSVLRLMPDAAGAGPSPSDRITLRGTR